MQDVFGQAKKLVDLIEYQEGSVVSKIIIQKDTGNVTLFAFSDGQGLSEHAAPFDALVHILEGEAEITITTEKVTKKHIVKEGQVIIMPANDPHALKAITKYKMLLIMIRS